MSKTCNSVNHICNLYSIRKHDINSSLNKIQSIFDENVVKTGSLINDFLVLRDEMPWDTELKELIN